MADEINVHLVVQTAREWAAKSKQSEAMVAADALAEICRLRDKYKGEKYQEELAKLYRKYCQIIR